MRFPRLVPRRTFLSSLAAWVGAGAILARRRSGGKESAPEAGPPAAPEDGIQTALSTPGRPLDRTSAAIFERHLGSAFQIVAGSGAASQVVHLTKVTRSQTIAGPGRNAPEPTPAFSLIFHGDSGPVLSQDTYRIEHSQLGVFPLFLVPIGPNQGDALPGRLRLIPTSAGPNHGDRRVRLLLPDGVDPRCERRVRQGRPARTGPGGIPACS